MTPFINKIIKKQGCKDKQKIMYTANFGNYDERYPSADFYFDENNNPLDGCSSELSDRLKAKLYKVLNPFSYDIWIDSNVEFVQGKREEFERLVRGDFCVLKHPFDNNLYEEVERCHQLGYIDNKQRGNIIDLYKSEGMDLKSTPIYSCGILCRTARTRAMNEFWWSLICQYSFRDQLTFPYVVHKFKDIRFHVLDIDIFDNEYLVVNNHNDKR